MWTNDRGLLSVDLSSSINQLLELYSQCDRIAVLLPSLNEFQRCECNSSASPSCPPHLDPLTLLARSVKLTTLRRRRIHRTSIHSHSLPGLCRRQCTILRLFFAFSQPRTLHTPSRTPAPAHQQPCNFRRTNT